MPIQQTGTIRQDINIAGIKGNCAITRTGDGADAYNRSLPAGVAGAISAGGVDGLAVGHGFTNGQLIDLQWLDGVDLKGRRGITIDTAETTDILFDDSPAAEGDALPAEDTAVVVSARTEILAAWDGDLTVMLSALAVGNAQIDFRSSSASLKVVQLTAGIVWPWATGNGEANALAGETVAKIVASNGRVGYANNLSIGVLTDSTL